MGRPRLMESIVGEAGGCRKGETQMAVESWVFIGNSGRHVCRLISLPFARPGLAAGSVFRAVLSAASPLRHPPFHPSLGCSLPIEPPPLAGPRTTYALAPARRTAPAHDDGLTVVFRMLRWASFLVWLVCIPVQR